MFLEFVLFLDISLFIKDISWTDNGCVTHVMGPYFMRKLNVQINLLISQANLVSFDSVNGTKAHFRTWLFVVGIMKLAGAQQNLKIYATSDNSDQTAHPRSLIRVFADRTCLLQPPGYPKRDKGEAMPFWMDLQADVSLCWTHRSYCRFCHALGSYLSSFPGYTSYEK